MIRTALTANRFLRGHRIRVQVTSSFFPHLDRNPNTGEASATAARLVPARQTVFHDIAPFARHLANGGTERERAISRSQTSAERPDSARRQKSVYTCVICG